jgi:hypothetical protein
MGPLSLIVLFQIRIVNPNPDKPELKICGCRFTPSLLK